MAMYWYDRPCAASAISAIVPDPSLQRVCICKSPRSFSRQAGRAGRRRRASAVEMKSWRTTGTVFAGCGGFSIQFRICFSINGPTLRSSVNDRFCLMRLATSADHTNALRAARRKAREGIPVSRSACWARSSAISVFDSTSEIRFRMAGSAALSIAKCLGMCGLLVFAVRFQL